MGVAGLFRATWNRLSRMSPSDLLDLCLPSRHNFLVKRQRRSTFDHRIQAAARYIAVLTTVWIGIDALSFPGEVWIPLAGQRLLTSVLLAVLSLAALHEHRGPLVEIRALGVMLVVLGFFISASHTLSATHASMLSPAAMSAYVDLPFLVAAGICLFPITAIEGLVAAGFVVGSAMLAAPALPLGGGQQMFNAGSFWLLETICAMATLGGMLQLRSLITVSDHSVRDGLTGLTRRSFGEELLATLFAAAERADQPLSVLYIDLDRFKAINDDYGHEAGDIALEAAATAIRESLRDQDTAVRWGGEEFLVILPNTNVSGARTVAERLGRRGLGQRPEGRPLTASIGIAERLADSAASVDALVALGDKHLYAAKHAGRNRIVDATGDPWLFTNSALAA